MFVKLVIAGKRQVFLLSEGSSLHYTVCFMSNLGTQLEKINR